MEFVIYLYFLTFSDIFYYLHTSITGLALNLTWPVLFYWVTQSRALHVKIELWIVYGLNSSPAIGEHLRYTHTKRRWKDKGHRFGDVLVLVVENIQERGVFSGWELWGQREKGFKAWVFSLLSYTESSSGQTQQYVDPRKATQWPVKNGSQMALV
jgi:hypothetical protein